MATASSGLRLTKGVPGFRAAFKRVLANDDAVLFTRLSSGDVIFEVKSHGSSRFTLDHPTDMVWRRSSFVCGRTIGILSDHVAADLPKTLIANLAAGKEMIVTLTAMRPG